MQTPHWICMLLKLAWVGGLQRKGIWVPIEKKDILKGKLPLTPEWEGWPTVAQLQYPAPDHSVRWAISF